MELIAACYRQHTYNMPTSTAHVTGGYSTIPPTRNSAHVQGLEFPMRNVAAAWRDDSQSMPDACHYSTLRRDSGLSCTWYKRYVYSADVHGSAIRVCMPGLRDMRSCV